MISLLTDNGRTLALMDFIDHYSYPAHHLNQMLGVAFSEIVNSDTPAASYEKHRAPKKDKPSPRVPASSADMDDFETDNVTIMPFTSSKKDNGSHTPSHTPPKKSRSKASKNITPPKELPPSTPSKKDNGSHTSKSHTPPKKSKSKAAKNSPSEEPEVKDDESDGEAKDDESKDNKKDNKKKKDLTKKKTKGKKRDRDSPSDSDQQLPSPKKQKTKHLKPIPSDDEDIYKTVTKVLLRSVYDGLFPAGRICTCMKFYSFINNNAKSPKKKYGRKVCSGGIQCFWPYFVCPCGITISPELGNKKTHFSTCAVFRKLLLEATIDILNTYRIGPVGEATRKALHIDLNADISKTVMVHYSKKMAELPKEQKAAYDLSNKNESINPVYRDAKLLWNLDEVGVENILNEHQKYDSESHFFCPLCGTVVRTSGRFYEHLREACKVPCAAMQAPKELYAKFMEDIKVSVNDTYRKAHARMTEWAKNNNMRANKKVIDMNYQNLTEFYKKSDDATTATTTSTDEEPKPKKKKKLVFDETEEDEDSKDKEEDASSSSNEQLEAAETLDTAIDNEKQEEGNEPSLIITATNTEPVKTTSKDTEKKSVASPDVDQPAPVDPPTKSNSVIQTNDANQKHAGKNEPKTKKQSIASPTDLPTAKKVVVDSKAPAADVEKTPVTARPTHTQSKAQPALVVNPRHAAQAQAPPPLLLKKKVDAGQISSDSELNSPVKLIPVGLQHQKATQQSLHLAKSKHVELEEEHKKDLSEEISCSDSNEDGAGDGDDEDETEKDKMKAVIDFDF